MSSIGPYQSGNTIRIPLEFSINGVPMDVDQPIVQRLIMPDGSDHGGFPISMTTIKPGIYMLEIVLTIVGNYTAIIEAQYGEAIIGQTVEFVIERPWGFPKIEIASNS